MFNDLGVTYTPFLWNYSGGADIYSIQRFGFNPVIQTTNYFVNLNPDIQQAQQGADIPLAVASLITRLITWYDPEPVMLKGTVTMELRPDIFVGCRFEYAPYRDGERWQFYIEGVEHNFVFGGESTTTLKLSRGLPSKYFSGSQDFNSDLFEILTGRAQRIQGHYQTGVTSGVTLIGLANSKGAQDFLQAMGQSYVSPHP